MKFLRTLFGPDAAASVRPEPQPGSGAGGTKPPAEVVNASLRTVNDPEVGINVVDLGLVYGVEATPDRIAVDLTLTTPACPLGEHVIESAVTAIRQALPDVPDVAVRLVWDPPWTPERMSEEARRRLGWS